MADEYAKIGEIAVVQLSDISPEMVLISTAICKWGIMGP